MEHAAQLSLSDPRIAILLQIPNAERANALAAILDGPGGSDFRQEASRWLTQALSVERLVPQVYVEWRPIVHDAMVFFGSHLSSSRLAPKLVDQFLLPPNTPPEKRLSRLIARVPGLQKLGQVIARNRHLHPCLRRELSQLENGIRDVTAEEIRTIIVQALAPKLERHAVEIENKILAEASVSAVVRFTWYNRERRQRERGVFKVIKPYVPTCFAEDMELLGGLADHLGSRHAEYGFAEHVLPETFNDVRRLLQHEVKFVVEQANLAKALRDYSGLKWIRVPRLIRPLCTSTITAMTEEYGEKITKVAAMPISRRERIAEQLIDALIAVPLLTPATRGMFHADPHAGNLLFNKRTGMLTLLDWALTGHVTEQQRRQAALLFLMIVLRDSEAVCKLMEALSLGGKKRRARQTRVIRKQVTRFFDALPWSRLPRPVDIVNLLERTGWEGVRFPSHLVLLRKVMFTLDGILHEIAGPSGNMELVMVQRLLQNWLKNPGELGWPLSLRDWVAVYWSAVLYPSKLAIGAVQQLIA